MSGFHNMPMSQLIVGVPEVCIKFNGKYFTPVTQDGVRHVRHWTKKGIKDTVLLKSLTLDFKFAVGDVVQLVLKHAPDASGDREIVKFSRLMVAAMSHSTARDQINYKYLVFKSLEPVEVNPDNSAPFVV